MFARGTWVLLFLSCVSIRFFRDVLREGRSRDLIAGEEKNSGARRRKVEQTLSVGRELQGEQHAAFRAGETIEKKASYEVATAMGPRRRETQRVNWESL